jgi:hypothetical protein
MADRRKVGGTLLAAVAEPAATPLATASARPDARGPVAVAGATTEAALLQACAVVSDFGLEVAHSAPAATGGLLHWIVIPGRPEFADPLLRPHARRCRD